MTPKKIILFIVIAVGLALSYRVAVDKGLIPNFLAGTRTCTLTDFDKERENWPKCDDGDGGNGTSKRTLLNGKKIGDSCRYVDLDGKCCQVLPEFGERSCLK
ncbi:MAG: hypothetical protein U1A23_04795 [Candidatus Sungbacteria bacterium]|nr:hypothetical protein [bacterium]MDZ4286222.1 hypothetical protein [Candidatus Sungbacteria bacterium]